MAQAGVLHLAIVGYDDIPLYEADLLAQPSETVEKPQYLHQFVLHAALDNVEDMMWDERLSNSLFLKQVDSFNNLQVWAWITATGIRFLLLTDRHGTHARSEESIRLFFADLYELWVKVMLNPFHTAKTPIKSALFDPKVRSLSAKHFKTAART